MKRFQSFHLGPMTMAFMLFFMGCGKRGESSENVVDHEHSIEVTAMPATKKALEKVGPRKIPTRGVPLKLPALMPSDPRSPVPVTVEGDLDGDGNVDCDDFHIFQKNFGCGNDVNGEPCVCDLNADGTCDIADLTIIGLNLSPTVGGFSNCTEPQEEEEGEDNNPEEGEDNPEEGEDNPKEEAESSPDLDGDGDVDCDDLQILDDNWGCESDLEEEPCVCDVDGDGICDYFDYDMMELNWGGGIDGDIMDCDYEEEYEEEYEYDGDLDWDGDVDCDDLQILEDNWGCEEGDDWDYCECDANWDGVCDLVDRNLINLELGSGVDGDVGPC